MSPVEIIFVLLGIGILIASCFVGSKEEKTDTAILLQDEALELQKEEIKNCPGSYRDSFFLLYPFVMMVRMSAGLSAI